MQKVLVFVSLLYNGPSVSGKKSIGVNMAISFLLNNQPKTEGFYEISSPCCIADLPPCRPSPRKVCNRKICNIADLSPRGKVCNIADLPLFIADLPPFLWSSGFSFLYILKKLILNLNRRLYMQYLTFNDKTSIFSYVNDRYFSIKLRQLIWIYKDKPYNDWNGIGGRSAMGEGLQWFFNTIADLPGGGGKVCNITPHPCETRHHLYQTPVST